MHVAKDVNLDQLAAELEAKIGHSVPVQARHDPETLKPTAVDAEVDDAVLAETVEEHVAVWPEPPPDPLDVMRDAVQAMDDALAAKPSDLAKVLRSHLVPILQQLDPILRAERRHT